MSDLPDLPTIGTDGIDDSSDRKSWVEVLRDYGGKNLEAKKNWYSSVAEAYNRVRPRYPQEIITRSIEITQLPKQSKILELGCGPGIATVPFAQLGFSMLSLEPNREASELAKQNCASYPNVEVQNLAFEEWELKENQFEAVLAATSWHWLDPAISYAKSWAALKEDGHLILLWNTPPQVDGETYQIVDEVYQILAPSIPLYARHEGIETHQADFLKFSKSIMASGYFDNVKYERSIHKVIYHLDDYLLLLSTLSPYIALAEEQRIKLFAKLRELLHQNRGDRLTLSYISAFHVARKI
ncbi:MAG: SAM-dependent methyltransferase [Pseudanabaena frigida]|uniref:SAM-dependent methyltransferase n=1 Tax=Pseudanabaena frigida TaxID=945775 RepID=A0A2W4VTV7_9CYAN|nr:MAG: SAM-dependent methyltransferase [Pseudanabaena frigida]